MAAYRFCRTDDIALLVDALNRCWAPDFPDESPITPAAFKRSIRDLQVWCSSCMVAFEGSDPIGVLIGAKRPSGTLVHTIAVHPDHRRQGHGRHLLASLGSKLAILGPPRIVAEVPKTLVPACELFSTSGYVQEAVLTDYVLSSPGDFVPRTPLHESEVPLAGAYVIPVTIDDLAANGLLGEPHPQTCWERSVETLTARKDDIAGLAVASDDRIEAYVLYVRREVDPARSAPEALPPPREALRRDLDEARRAKSGRRASPEPWRKREMNAEAAEIVSLRPLVEDGGTRLAQLLSRFRAQGMTTLRFPKVHPDEVSKELLETLGFRPAADGHLLYAATLRPGSSQNRRT